MFPKKASDAYIASTGERSTLGAVIGSGGGGIPSHTIADAGKVLKVDNTNNLAWGDIETFTPDYENDILIIGIREGYNYYIPMQKVLVINAEGYEIKTNPESTSFAAKIDIYSLDVVNGVPTSTFIKTLVHNDDNTYEDDNIKVSYTGSKWDATLKVSMKDLTTGNNISSPVQWSYNTDVDYKWYIPET